MNLDSLLKEFATDLGTDDFIHKNQQTEEYTLNFEDNIKVDLSSSVEGFLMRGIIGNYPQQNVEFRLLKALEANLLGSGTRGSIIGLTEDGNMLTLSHEVDYNISYKEFKEKVEDFITVINFWRKEIKAVV